MPTPATPIFFTLAGMIDQLMAQRTFQMFTAAIRDGYEECHLLVQSAGGFVGDGIALHNFLKNLPINLVTYNVGQVSSAAVFVYLAGKKRIAAESAVFMIHRPANMSPGGTAEAVASVADSLLIDDERSEALLKQLTAMPHKKWTTYAKNNLHVSAKDSISYGMTHELGLFAPTKGAPIYNVSNT